MLERMRIGDNRNSDTFKKEGEEEGEGEGEGEGRNILPQRKSKMLENAEDHRVVAKEAVGIKTPLINVKEFR